MINKLKYSVLNNFEFELDFFDVISMKKSGVFIYLQLKNMGNNRPINRRKKIPDQIKK